MIDNRIFTFLELCNVMNYHKTAENLNMTQPAVTQHIKHLESLYNCKLFNYTNKKLAKTEKCLELERFARTAISVNNIAIERLSDKPKLKINIGATKTIGDYILINMLSSLFKKSEYEINIIIDNTENLLDKLNHFELDLLMLEGYVDKEKYLSREIIEEEIVGVCSLEHPFAFKKVSLQEVFSENILLREAGSGTRAVFEQFLFNNGYSTEAFKNKSIISSNKLIEQAVQNNYAISFLYSIIPKHNDKLATFRIQDNKILHQFNYIFLNEAKAKTAIEIFSDLI